MQSEELKERALSVLFLICISLWFVTRSFYCTWVNVTIIQPFCLTLSSYTVSCVNVELP